MTKAMCPRTSKRKHTKSSRENISEDCKENLSHITSQNKIETIESHGKKQLLTRSNVLASKENIAVVKNTQNSTNFHSNCSLRKSERHRKSTFNNNDYIYNSPKGEHKISTSAKRNVLSDKSNTDLTRETKTNIQSKCLQTTLNRCNTLTKVINSCQLNEDSTDEGINKPHIPIYKTVCSSGSIDVMSNFPLEKIEAVYDFDEVNENEEPIKKRKKKKRVNVKKPKMGPKALTINNIKFSSTESLVSFPEKQAKQKKPKTKMVASCVKPYSSVTSLNDSEDTCYSVQSFMSHPPSVLLCKRGEMKDKHELSVLQETQSENHQSLVHENINPDENVSEIMDDNGLNASPIVISTVLPNDSRVSQNNSALLHQRCYSSKKSHSVNNTHGESRCGSRNETLPNQSSHYSANISTGHSSDFLSSTPCKRSSLVVRHNSVFSDSNDRDVALRVRPSTGFIKDASENMVIDDKCFGFDEPEELEEPLVSPIKNINLQESRIFPRLCHDFLTNKEIENPKPNLKEVIEKLKATIPKARSQTKQTSEVFNNDSSSSSHSNTSSPISKEVETTLNFIKPPRRSYERQRRIRYYSEHEDEDEDEEDEEENHKKNQISRERNTNNENLKRENEPKPAKKCYQKKNVSKVVKAPQVPKAKQRILKEEAELERLAAQMNAQFQEIEKCSLVVE